MSIETLSSNAYQLKVNWHQWTSLRWSNTIPTLAPQTYQPKETPEMLGGPTLTKTQHTHIHTHMYIYIIYLFNLLIYWYMYLNILFIRIYCNVNIDLKRQNRCISWTCQTEVYSVPQDTTPKKKNQVNRSASEARPEYPFTIVELPRADSKQMGILPFS